MLINCPLRNLKLATIVLVREMSRRIVERSFAKCSYHTFKIKTCSLACHTCKSSNKLCKSVSTSCALIWFSAKDICAIFLWPLLILSFKLLLEHFKFLPHCILFTFRCHLHDKRHSIDEFRLGIDIHGCIFRSCFQIFKNLSVELCHELLLLSLVFHDLEL
jgi:hypothetical protein